jgi:type II secretory pathway component PulL
MAKFYTVEKEINGTKYVAQFNGISAALKAVDESYIEGTNNTSVEKLSRYLFSNVIVEPKGLTADDFESMEEFNEVISFAREVMQGDFREEKDKKSAKATSKE